MNIYLVKAACGVDWDETKAYVCVAKDENEALSLTAWCKDCKMFQTPGDEDYPYNCYCVGHPCDDCKYYEVDNEEH